MHVSFEQVDHRPWPLPKRRWAWSQRWLDLAFIHFEADAAELRRKIPPGIELDLYNGKAWVGIVPFRMEKVTKRGFPAPSFLCDFPEINVRTYVTRDGKPGVWFFSLDVPNGLAVWAARTFFHLPYFKAEMSVRNDEAAVRYSMRRGNRKFAATFGGTEVHPSVQGSFEEWATERYCLYSSDGGSRLFRAEVHHKKWPLEGARLELTSNDIAGFPLGDMHPIVLFSRRLDVVVWPPEQVG